MKRKPRHVGSSDPARRENYCQDVRRPGKFEGESCYVPYFWDAFLNGMADSDNGKIIGFKVSTEDVALFPELRGRRRVRIYEDSQGFVRED